ncbi:MAG: cupin domain-containing protein [Oscillospiraceae bacterium]|nr:cupin domain-containing protein [Oscillospiraceae bacterium]
MKNPYLIRMEQPEDCVMISDKEGIYYRMFQNPVTGRLKNELDCMQFHEPSIKMVGYHEHTYGTETFFISQGKFLCNCMGRGFTMDPGDILHIQPWMGHSFIPIEPESRLNIMFMDIDQQYALTQPRKRLQENFPGVFEDPQFQNSFRKANGGVGLRTVPVQVNYPKEQVQQLRPSGYALREHEYKGIKMHLKIAKYETEGIKEVWEHFMQPGFYCEWDAFLPEYRVFYVTGGKLKCWVRTSASEKLEFTAEKENIVTIPPYTPFGFEVAQEAQMYDMDCGARLQDLCEELETATAAADGKIPEKDALLKLCKAHDFNITAIGNK